MVAESAFLWVKGLRFAYPECAVLDNLSLAWPPGQASDRLKAPAKPRCCECWLVN